MIEENSLFALYEDYLVKKDKYHIVFSILNAYLSIYANKDSESI